MGEFKGIWVFSEKEDLMLEMLGKGRELADKLNAKLSAILLGYKVRDRAQSLIGYGADEVLVVDHPLLERFHPEPYVSAIANLAKQNKPEIILVGSTKDGKELASRIATRLKTGCVPDCIQLDVDENGKLVMSRIVYSGNAVAKEICLFKPQIATVPLRAFKKLEYQEREGRIVEAEIQMETPRTEVLEVREVAGTKEKLEEANIIVAGGRGVERKEDFKILVELAEVLGGRVVGNTRPLAEDRKWFTDWIGLSGRKVRPTLYIACGISGAIQHVAGMRDSHIVVAINKDPEAPIFDVADYIVVGDLYQVVPALTSAFKKLLKAG